MKKDECQSKLKELIQINIDTVYAYNRALDEIRDSVIQAQLKGFREDYLGHIDELSDEMLSMGAKPPGMSKDLKGHIVEAYTALRAAGGSKGALKALKRTEEMAHRHYGNFVPQAPSTQLKDILRRHLSNGRNHLDYITNNLKVM